MLGVGCVVVVQEFGAYGVLWGEFEVLLELLCVVVFVPDCDLVVGQRVGGLLRVVAGDVEHQCWCAVGGGAVECYVVHRVEFVECGGEQCVFVCVQCFEVELEHVLGGGAHVGQ